MHRWLCAIPALLLTGLFYFDQNISLRVVNSKESKLKKGAAYSLDMFALSVITGALSICGLPWMCGATVQSMANTKALSFTAYCPDERKEIIESVVETRATGFIVHAMVASSLLLLPTLSRIPIPVVSGIFLYLGKKLSQGNSFIERITDSFAERKRLAADHPVNVVGRKKVAGYTFIQLQCLAILWAVKQNKRFSIFFPSAIGFLMATRAWLLPRIFSKYDLDNLGDSMPTSNPNERICEKRPYNLRRRMADERVRGGRV